MLKIIKFQLKLVQLYLEHAILNYGVENSSFLYVRFMAALILMV